VLAIAALSCGVGYGLPSAAANPTAAPGEIDTVIAGTANAAQTQTAFLLPDTATPSLTPTVTRTPTLTPTVTPTFIYVLKSPIPTKAATPTGGGGSSGSDGYACALVSQKPEDGTEFNPNASFDMVWTVRNSGSKTWLAGNADFAYVSGRKMHEQDVYDLARDVAPGDTVSLTVDMRAPKVLGDWKTVWTLRAGNKDFCHVNVTITVN
jgi:hypothetical protein